MIKAIETEYAGYRFRSRLEARWAVFFDALGIKWEYEPEGFELPSGRYLPDFLLPELELWIEIKGKKATEKEHWKAAELARSSQLPVMLIQGNIGMRWIEDSQMMRKGWQPEYSITVHFGTPSIACAAKQKGTMEFSGFPYQNEFLRLMDFLLSHGYGFSFASWSESYELLVQYDREYYESKYHDTHPRWQYGWTNNFGWPEGNWFIDGIRRDHATKAVHGFCLSENQPYETSEVWGVAYPNLKQAFDKARSARFGT